MGPLRPGELPRLCALCGMRVSLVCCAVWRVQCGGFLFPSGVPVMPRSGGVSFGGPSIQMAPLTLEDPLFPTHNAAAACFAFPNIAAEFEAAVLALSTFTPSLLRPTPLSAILSRNGYEV